MRRVVASALGGAGAAVALFACSVVNSLDYLTNGPAADASLDGDAALVDGDADRDAAPPAAEIVAAGQGLPDLLAHDDEALYWLNKASGSIMTMPKKEGGEPRRIATAGTGIGALAVDRDPAGFVFWLAGPSVFRAGKSAADGTGTEILTPAVPPRGLAVDGTSIYVLALGEDTGEGLLLRARHDGSDAVTLATPEEPQAVTVHEGTLFWLALDGSGADVVRALPTDAADAAAAERYGGPDDLMLVTPPHLFVADDDAVYFGDRVDGVIGRVLRVPSVASTELFYEERAQPGALASAGDHLWFTDLVGGTVRRIPRAGGAVEIVVSDLRVPSSLVVDDAFVWFTIQGAGAADGAVARLPR